jgi:cyclase
MLRTRIIVCLLVQKGGLVKTTKFAEPKYVGDPLNSVRIFNEKEVDELVIADIDASVLGKEPDYSLIEKLAAECRMPVCYAGGVKAVGQIDRIIGLGVEKVALGSAAVESPELISLAASRVGSQSIVVVIDAKKTGLLGRYSVFTHNGSRNAGVKPAELAKQAAALGAGEILLNSIDQDGTMKGYDHALIDEVRDAVTLPMSVLGGAGSIEDIRGLVDRYGTIGAAAGSLFVFKGRYRAVLITYPKPEEKRTLFVGAGRG